jgi:hypothetical protein
MSDSNGSKAYPHTDTVRSGAALPSFSMQELDQILHMRNEGDARLIATIVSWFMHSSEGRKVILEVLGTDDDRIRAIARDVYLNLPVRPHTHRAQSVKLSTYVRGLSRIGAIIGALIGGLLGWLLTSIYAVTTISFGTPAEMHSVSVTWVKVAIGILCILGCALVGSLVGGPRRQKEQLVNVSVNLEMAAHTTTAPAVVSNTDGGAGR